MTFGLIALFIPNARARKFGLVVWGIVGVFILIYAGFFLLGSLFSALWPFIILIGVIYLIYLYMQRRKNKREQKAAKNMSTSERSERIDFLKDL